MDGRAGRQGFRFFTVCRIEQGRAEGLALEHGFFGDFADRMWDDRCVVMGFVEGFSCIFQGLDIFFRLDGDSQFKGPSGFPSSGRVRRLWRPGRRG